LTTETHTQTPEVSSPRKLSWFSKFLLGLNAFAVVGLILSYIAPYINPDVFWPTAFFGLAYPIFILVNMLFLLYWLIRRRKLWMISLGVLVLGWTIQGRTFQWRFASPAPAPKNCMRVISYNVKLFDLYNWSHNADTRSKIFKLIDAEKPAIFCVQEFFTEDEGEFQNLDTLRQLLSLPYTHVEYTVTLRKTDHWGVATFSKYPIVATGHIVFNSRSNNRCIYSDLLVEGDTIRVYNMHLQSINFGYVDYKFLSDLKAGKDVTDEAERSKNIIRRLNIGFVRRSRQADAVAENIAACPYPVIVCGDFNDTPVSYVYQTISKNLTDAFVESGTGFGKTFVNPLPFPRIDYILHSKQFQSYNFNVNQQQGLSDHYPIMCDIYKTKK
jgi:endonuclease/exonuclease/phosphatase family metal-dependent hydrolase